jgi:hypothetical protein
MTEMEECSSLDIFKIGWVSAGLLGRLFGTGFDDCRVVEKVLMEVISQTF